MPVKPQPPTESTTLQKRLRMLVVYRFRFVFVAIGWNLKILGHLVKYIHFAIRQLSPRDLCVPWESAPVLV